MMFWVGIDDTDSLEGMCTTYLAVKLISALKSAGMEVLNEPRLIRLNPNIPYKTRGNGAVAFLVDGDIDSALDIVDKYILRYAEIESKNTNPGVAIVENKKENIKMINLFSRRVIKDVVSIEDALKVARKLKNSELLMYKNGRGIIGALAAIGVELYDYTYELLTYRMVRNFGKDREIDEKSFFLADIETYPETWDTVDWMNKTVIAVPNSRNNPVLYGIRGESKRALNKAKSIVKTEKYDCEKIFITNQGTDMHLIDEDSITELLDYRSYIIRGRVVEKPHYIRGGHVFFSIETKFGKVKCAAFEPTKQFRKIVLELREGDVVEVYGGYKRKCVNLEKINIVKLADVFVERNPICPKCGRRMESAGKGQGYRCRKCKTYELGKIKVRVERKIDTGYYEVPPCARRHISKPLIRAKVKKKHVFR